MITYFACGWDLSISMESNLAWLKNSVNSLGVGVPYDNHEFGNI